MRGRAIPGCVTGLAPDPTGEGMVLFEVDGGAVKAEVIASYFNSTSDACGTLSFQRTLGIGTFPLSMVGAPTITVSLSYENDDSGTRRRGSGTLTLTRVRLSDALLVRHPGPPRTASRRSRTSPRRERVKIERLERRSARGIEG